MRSKGFRVQWSAPDFLACSSRAAVFSPGGDAVRKSLERSEPAGLTFARREARPQLQAKPDPQSNQGCGWQPIDTELLKRGPDVGE